jgi:adenosylcobinamide-GDP ribazoletransferase
VRILRSLVAAIAFFTRIPTGGRAFPSDLPAALPWLPAIGLFLGGAASMIAMACGDHAPRLAALLVVGVWALLAGGLHLEGLADVCDALGASRRGEEAYRIMKDPHTGAYGVIGVVLVVLAQVEAIAAISPAKRPGILWIAPLVARVIPVAGLKLIEAPKFVTSGLAFEARRADGRLIAAAALGGAALAFALGPIWPAFMGLLVGWIALYLITRPLGGITGDVCGAALELTQTAYLVAAALA